MKKENFRSPIYTIDSAKRKAIKKIEKNWRGIIDALCECYGVNGNDENFTETPRRIAEMLVLERCSGMNSKEVCIELLKKSFPNMYDTKDGKEMEDYDQLIVTTNPVITYGICPHHFENVEYHIWTAYVPKKNFVGLSKFSRFIDLFVRQPILQETLTIELANIIEEALEPKGVFVLVKGKHDCMIARGARTNSNQYVVTSSCRGVLQNETMKNEFFELIKNKD